MANEYVVGQVIRISAEITIAGVDTDPTAVTAKVKKPDASILNGAASKDATGKYHYDFTADLPGIYRYRFEGTGGAAGAGEGDLYVKASEVT